MKTQTYIRCNTNGFTLQEIIIALIIVGVLVSLVLPKFTDSMRRVTNQEGEALLIGMFDAQKEYQFETGAYTTDETDLDVSYSTPKSFNAPQALNSNLSCEGAGPVTVLASIQRAATNRGYTLYITDAGQVVCCPATGGDQVCQTMGYDFGW